ncbi:MAG: hypothetical protein HY822_11430 [Acidobacteria bacterium]|nr:hypothetical protein [Acidobacteriota bacterium]
MQRNALPEAEQAAIGFLVSMNDPNAESSFVRDISPALEGGQWRWTYVRPELKMHLKSVRGLKLVWEIGLAVATFERTGPVTISFFVNGQPAGKLPCPKPGDYRFEQPVRPSLLRANGENFIAAQADKLWVSPTDGVKLGFTLTRAGFIQ